MKCSKCNAEIQTGSNFCPQCGATSDTTSAQPLNPPPATQRTPEQSKTNAPKTILVICGAVVLVAILALVLAFVLRKPERVVVTPEVAPVKPGPPITGTEVKPINPGPPITQAPTSPPLELPKKQPAPPEVLEYLDFVRKVENSRVAMRDAQAAYLLKKYVSGNIGKLLADMIGQLASPEDPPPPTHAPMEDLKKVAAAWEQLIRIFDSREPPPQCRDLAGVYRTALGQYSNAMSSLFVAVIKGDIATAQRVGAMQDDLDKLLIRANEELAKIRSTYDIKADWAITPDKGGGSLLQPSQ